ncbi:MAG: hypothetical protein R3F02_17055 [Thiolinea sp.]
MPKLIIKQDVNEAERRARRSKWLSLSGLFLLLVTVAVAAFFLSRPVITSPAQEPLSLDSAADSGAKAAYISMHNVFNELSAEYEKLSTQGPDDYEKNLKLLGKSDSILRHLDKMQDAVVSLGLSNQEHRQLLNRQQFYKDYWQSKSHFRQLRVSRFEGVDTAGVSSSTKTVDQLNTLSESVPVTTETLPAAEQPKKFKFAKPPPGMELPEGFCDLSNPGSCKPGNDNSAALPTVDNVPLAEDIAEPILPPDDQPKKFKFAKPPPGMELPEGFCDLSNPGSCKPETAEVEMAVEQSNQTN